MTEIQPQDRSELQDALRSAASKKQRVRLGGGFSKDCVGGSAGDCDVTISTLRMKRVIEYDPRDLTVSVEPGLAYSDLTRILAAEGQMLPLDPPMKETSTVGGVVAANLSGPRRRQYGTARDLVIGMTYITAEGDWAETGGRVVKNVAGLDIHKLLIGSMGTLGAIASVNFRVVPAPEATRTFLMGFDAAGPALEARRKIAASQLQPVAVDLLNEAAAKRCGLEGWRLLVRAEGSEALLARYGRELEGATVADGEEALWEKVERLAPDWVGGGNLAAVKVSHKPAEVGAVLEAAEGPAWGRALSGVSWVGCETVEQVRRVQSGAGVTLVEWSDPARRPGLDLWPDPGLDFELMKELKRKFDPQGLLNPGRLHGRI